MKYRETINYDMQLV